MLTLTAAGNTARHEFTPEAGDKPCRLSFSLAVDTGKNKAGEKMTTWVSCALYGKRAESLWPFFKDIKSTKLVVTGQPWVAAKDDQGYINMTVRELTFMGSKQDQAQDASPEPSSDGLPF